MNENDTREIEGAEEFKRLAVVHERYRDSNAVLEHNANLGETVGELLETCSASGEIFGAPNPDLMEGLKGIDGRIYSPDQSI
jgi:hypothetical protein